jgi:hypothetical protein
VIIRRRFEDACGQPTNRLPQAVKFSVNLSLKPPKLTDADLAAYSSFIPIAGETRKERGTATAAVRYLARAVLTGVSAEISRHPEMILRAF